MEFIESIQVLGKVFFNLRFHNQRLNQTRKDFFGELEEIDLNNYLNIPENLDYQLYKCRVTYSQAIEKVEFESYAPRKIKLLKVVEANDLNYAYKFADRSHLNALFDQRGEADDVLIIRNGLLTDLSYANIALWNGKQWITPAQPILKGVRRQILLQKKHIHEQDIYLKDLPNFSKLRYFNAILDFGDESEFEIKQIINPESEISNNSLIMS
jgi:4-amino-4-deoxychorismate lyase